MREISKGMLQLAYENGAAMEFYSQNSSMWKWLDTQGESRRALLGDSQEFRIVNATGEGLILHELMEQADWNTENIEIDGAECFGTFGTTQEFLALCCINPQNICYLSLKKKTRAMTAKEIFDLPADVTFVWGNSFVKNVKRTYETSFFDGYILPNETEIRKFEVEV